MKAFIAVLLVASVACQSDVLVNKDKLLFKPTLMKDLLMKEKLGEMLPTTMIKDQMTMLPIEELLQTTLFREYFNIPLFRQYLEQHPTVFMKYLQSVFFQQFWTVPEFQQYFKNPILFYKYIVPQIQVIAKTYNLDIDTFMGDQYKFPTTYGQDLGDNFYMKFLLNKMYNNLGLTNMRIPEVFTDAKMLPFETTMDKLVDPITGMETIPGDFKTVDRIMPFDTLNFPEKTELVKEALLKTIYLNKIFGKKWMVPEIYETLMKKMMTFPEYETIYGKNIMTPEIYHLMNKKVMTPEIYDILNKDVMTTDVYDILNKNIMTPEIYNVVTKKVFTPEIFDKTIMTPELLELLKKKTFTPELFELLNHKVLTPEVFDLFDKSVMTPEIFELMNKKVFTPELLEFLHKKAFTPEVMTPNVFDLLNKKVITPEVLEMLKNKMVMSKYDTVFDKKIMPEIMEPTMTNKYNTELNIDQIMNPLVHRLYGFNKMNKLPFNTEFTKTTKDKILRNMILETITKNTEIPKTVDMEKFEHIPLTVQKPVIGSNIDEIQKIKDIKF